MINKQPIIAILFGLIFITIQYLYLPMVDEVDFYSLFSEGLITIIILILLSNLHNLHNNKTISFYLTLGFSMLYVSLLTDTLDEVFDHPGLLTTILEDICQALGFVIILIAINKWIAFDEEQNEELKRRAITAESTRIYKSMLKATHHILNNLLNKMQLFRMRALKSKDFDEEIIKKYDSTIEEASSLVEKLSQVENVTVKDIWASVDPANGPDSSSKTR